MAKKFVYGMNARALKATPPKWLMYSTAIVGLLTASKVMLIQNIPGVAEEIKEFAGQWFDYIMSLAQTALSVCVIFTGYQDNDKPGSDKPGYSNDLRGLRTVLILIATGVIFLFLSSCSRKILDISRSVTEKDSTWKTTKVVPVPVAGGQTRPVNMDSLRRMFEQYTKAQPPAPANAVVPQLALPTELINKLFAVPDESGRYELQYWMSATGELMAKCMAKDTIVQALVEENNRLVRRSEVKTEIKTIYKVPGWVKGFIGAFIILAIAGIVWVVVSWKSKAVKLAKNISGLGN